MQFDILGSPTSWHVQQLAAAACQQGHEVNIRSFSSLQAVIERRAATRPLDDSVLLVRSMPRGTLEQVIFRMDVLSVLAQGGQRVINCPRSLEIAIDKYLGLWRLQRAGLLVPRTIACQELDEALRACEELGGDVVIKPLFGSEGRGVVRLRHVEPNSPELQACLTTTGVFYVQEFIAHPSFDYRLFVVGDDVFGMRRHNERDWRLNVRLGARVTHCKVTDELRQIAIDSTRAVTAEVAAVDVLPDREGNLFVLEVNACPGWKALQSVCPFDVANHICAYATQASLARKP